MTKIADENFDSPNEINMHPCVTADRWLNAVPETVSISQVCQDPSNTSLVVIDISLVGAFLFTPTLKILSVDGDTSYTQMGVVAPFALGHYKNPEIPINTNCATWHGQVVFDIGTVVNDYLNAQEIVFQLCMVGQVPQAFGVTYPNQTAIATYQWQKGVLPSPVNLQYSNGNLGVTFEYLGEGICDCELICSPASGVTQNLTFCPNEKQTVILYQDPASQDPYSVFIQLADALGNQSNLEFQSVFNTVPLQPVVIKADKPKRVEVSMSKISANGIPVEDDVQYQVLKYEGNSSNVEIWKDWSHRDWSNFVDYEVTEGKTYGYAIRFKGIFGDLSRQSVWTEIIV